jgi:hypothetical protein
MKSLSLIFLLFLIACHSMKKDALDEFYAGEKIFNDIEFESANLKYNVADMGNLPDSSDIASMEFVGDNIVVMTRKSNIYVLDKNYKEIAAFANDSLKMVGARTVFSKNSNEFFTYDLTKNIFHQFVFNESSNKWQYYRNALLRDSLHGLISMDFLPNNSLIATSVNNNSGKVINFTIDGPQKIIKYIGNIPNVKGQNSFVTGMEFRSSTSFDSSSDKIYVAHFYTDLIEAYDTEGKLQFKLHGPGNFRPVYQVGKQQQIPYFANTNETRVGYHDLDCDRNYLYALYSGKSSRDKDQKTIIYIFTKAGTPYKKIILDIDLYQIKVDQRNNRLYCFKTNAGADRKVIFFNTNEL